MKRERQIAHRLVHPPEEKPERMLADEEHDDYDNDNECDDNITLSALVLVLGALIISERDVNGNCGRWLSHGPGVYPCRTQQTVPDISVELQMKLEITSKLTPRAREV
jgi:hypothetical protein